MNILNLIEKDILAEMTFQTQEEKEQFAVSVSETVMERLMERIAPLLSTEQMNNLQTLMEDESVDAEQIIMNMSEVLPNFPEILGDEILGMKEEIALLLQATK